MMIAQTGPGGFGTAAIQTKPHPGGVGDKDELKDFRLAIAVQATPEQSQKFSKLARDTDAAVADLTRLLSDLDTDVAHQESAASQASAGSNSGDSIFARAAAVKAAFDKARAETSDFQASFSAAQKSGLKEISSRLDKALEELIAQERALDGAGGDESVFRARLAEKADALRKAVAAFGDEQSSLASEMGIVEVGDRTLTFHTPSFKKTATVADQTISVPGSAVISRVANEGGQNVFRVEVTDDLTDFQVNIASILAVLLNTDDRCGERVAIKDATLAPTLPAGVVTVYLHAQRWMCTRVSGAVIPNEIAEGDATVELRTIPLVKPDGKIGVDAQITSVDAKSFLADSLQSGVLGSAMKEKLAQAVLAVIASADLKTALPPAASDLARTQAVRFASPQVDGLSVVLTGEIRISEEQTKLLGEQIRQQASSRTTAVRKAN